MPQVMKKSTSAKSGENRRIEAATVASVAVVVNRGSEIFTRAHIHSIATRSLCCDVGAAALLV